MMNPLKKILMMSAEEKEKTSRVTYSKETLLILSKNAPCQATPNCLLSDFVGEDGLWDPEIWHQSFSVSSQKDKPAENVDDPVQGGLVLGPQRRSFQGGCHVRSQPSNGKTYQTTPKAPDGNTPKYTRQQSHQDHDQHRSNGTFEEKSNWNVEFKKKQDHNNGENQRRYKDYSKSYMGSKKRTSERHFHQGNIDEREPEWISYGPSSKFDTIELQGFEESDDFGWMGKEIPMDDVPIRKKKTEDIPEKETDTGNDTKKTPTSAANESDKEQRATQQSDFKEETVILSNTDDIKENSQEIKSRFSHWFDQQEKETQEKDVGNAVKSTATTNSSNVSAGSTDVHETDAFNRLIASIKATDKVKEQMQQRNQQIQALQSIMNVTKSQKPEECVQMSSLELTSSDGGIKPISHSKDLRKQLEMQKSVYQLKKRQIEQQQKSTLQMIAGDEPRSYSMPNVKNQTHSSPTTVTDERALATASLAAKLAVKKRKNEFSGLKVTNSETLSAKPSTSSSVPLTFESVSQDQAVQYISAPSTDGENKHSMWEEGISPKNTHQHESALLIAQMLAKAGVTEEQLKQLTFDQQELIISMVQNQFSRKEILKLVNIDTNVEYSRGIDPLSTPHQSSVQHSSIPTVRTNRGKETLNHPDKVALDIAGVPSMRKPLTLPETTYKDGCIIPSETVSAPYNHPTMMTSRPVPSRLFNHTVLPVHPAVISPVVPHIVASNIAHPLLPPVNQSTLSPIFQPTAAPISQPHPAFLLHMQQRLYASQVAQQQQQQQQQQQAVLAAIHQQHVASGKHSDKAAVVKNPGSETAQPDETFKNPLSQWFSREVLKHSQFPATPVDTSRIHPPATYSPVQNK